MRIAVALAIAIAAAAAPPATADDRAPTPQEIKDARRHFEVGKALIAKKQLATAIVELEAAFELDPRTEHLYNLGVAHQLNGENDVAIQYYRLFLHDAPPGAAARDAARYLADLEAKAAAARRDRRKQQADELARRPPPVPAIDPEVGEDTRRATEHAEQRARDLTAQIVGLTKQESDLRARVTQDVHRRDDTLALAHKWELDARFASSGSGRGQRIAGTLLISVGAAAISYSALDLENIDDRLDSRGNTPLMMPAGIGAMITGLYLYISGEMAVHSHRPASTFDTLEMTPTMGRTRVGMMLSMRF